MATPNKHISGKWTKEQREKAEKLLKSWTHQKKQLVTTIESDSIHKLETDDTSFLNELDSEFKEFCEHKSRQSKDVKTP